MEQPATGTAQDGMGANSEALTRPASGLWPLRGLMKSEEYEHENTSSGGLDMILPTIHSNGTGAQTLYDDYERARAALCDAEEALGKIEFNARDYYVQDDGAWTKAREERTEWYRQLRTMQADCLAVMVVAQDSLDAKAARMAGGSL